MTDPRRAPQLHPAHAPHAPHAPPHTVARHDERHNTCRPQAWGSSVFVLSERSPAGPPRLPPHLHAAAACRRRLHPRCVARPLIITPCDDRKGKALWYEVIRTGRREKDKPQWYPMSEIELTMPSYVLKLIKNYDDKANSLASGLAIRPLTAAEILAHLEDFGIDSTLAHGKVKQMSGGQRCRRAAY